MTDFKTIPVSEIHPDKNQPRKFFNEAALKELTESVKSKGVLQPVMVRPNGKGYILVCGERRLKASIAAGLKDVPAVIRNLSDQEALEIQFIENIQRDDVHPMDEATTFKSMIENKVKPYTVADIAAKINKPEKYVTHRLSLNNLSPELQNDFWKGNFLIGHAVLFSRLSPEDQKLCSKECRVWGGKKEFQSISNVKEFIQRNIVRNLSAAPFKKDDPTLNPEMGPCTSCPFRSGNNPTLFEDVKETDRCFKPGCFKVKMENWTIKKVEQILTEEPEVKLLMSTGNPILKQVVDLAKQYNVPILKSYDDFNTYGGYDGQKKVKGIWVNTNQIGTVEHVYVESKGKAAKSERSADGKPTNTAIDEEISGIKQRTKRAAELDDEKVWMRIHKEIVNTTTGKNGQDINMALITEKPLSKVDTAAVIYSMYQKAGSESDEIGKIFGFKSGYLHRDEAIKFADKILNATSAQFNKVCRIFLKGVLDSAMSSHTANGGQALLKQVAEQYYKKEIAAIELEQKEKQIKREERAGVRIKALQDQKKQTVVKTVSPPAAGARQNQKKKAVKK